ncbi:MAG: thioether cross-link-forming SCIFF peptide maturase [Ruminococcaceae bacterium]|nr:thioether cross-link-forming SCIFF peptide maturase [Oscillospiraceae bacterium]
MAYTTVHTFEMLGQYIAMDVASGAVHILDKLAYEVVRRLTPPLCETCPAELYAELDATREEIDEAYAELYALYAEGMLFSEDDYEQIAALIDRHPPVKALCLHISHDCNLRCKYCFAGTGNFGGARMLMPPEVAIDAMKFVAKASGKRRNIEVDFFGGEPLMAFDTVIKTVEYVRAHEKEWGKNFRFTITTNGLALDDKKIDFINREMDNVVLSLDGRPDVNDELRVDVAGNGSYSRIVPKLLKTAQGRNGKDYYVRGTFTKLNLDFAEDVLHMHELGFKEISVEPVVTSDPRLDFTPEDLPKIYAEYERLAKIMLDRAGTDEDFRFFHFMIDLEQGPCVIKRLRGCGAGAEYLAVTPDGELYPCHQFVGNEEFKIGTIYDPDHLNEDLRAQFAGQNVYTREGCRDCFARFYCSGGCSAANYNKNGDLNKPYAYGCDLERKRVECAIGLKAALAVRAAEAAGEEADA